MSEPLKLNLGCGSLPLDGYTNIDRTPQCLGIVQGEVYPLAGYADESADEIRASHVLEHFPSGMVAPILTDWVRALKPGGTLKIAVPNFRWIAQSYLNGDQFPLLGYVYGGQTDENDYHKTAFDEDGLREAFRMLGLVDIEPWTSDLNDCASLPVSLNLLGRKPVDGEVEAAAPEAVPEMPTEELPDGVTVEEYMGHPDRRFAHYTVKPGDVVAVMTAPRLGFTETADCAFKAFNRLGIQFEVVYGVFWTQALERAIQNARQQGAKYVLTVDYDSCFDWRDVQVLYGLMENCPAIGALAPVQMQREMGVALIGMRDPETDAPYADVSWDRLQEDVLPAGTAHFGLTMIRASCLGNMAHPWFREMPNPETGEWDAGRIDADVQFWLDFKEAGHQLCIAPRVVIGHLELMVTWPDRYFRPAVQSCREYHALGRPGRESNLWR